MPTQKLHPFDAWLDRTQPGWRSKNHATVHYYAMRAAWIEAEKPCMELIRRATSAIEARAKLVEQPKTKDLLLEEMKEFLKEREQ
jgi:hypothetical protein